MYDGLKVLSRNATHPLHTHTHTSKCYLASRFLFLFLMKSLRTLKENGPHLRRMQAEHLRPEVEDSHSGHGTSSPSACSEERSLLGNQQTNHLTLRWLKSKWDRLCLNQLGAPSLRVNNTTGGSLLAKRKQTTSIQKNKTGHIRNPCT